MARLEGLRAWVARRNRWRLAIEGLVLLYALAVLVAHLWPDEALSADAARLRANAPRASTEPMTLAYGLFGFTAPPGRDLWQYGRFFVAAYEATGEFPKDPEPPLKATVHAKDLCRFHEDGCFDKTLAALPDLPGQLESNREVLARYDALKGARSFGEVIRPTWSSPFPRYEEVLIAHRLTLRAALRAFEQGDPAGAWRTLEAELAFHRRLLAETSSLVGKMVAVRLVEQDLRLHAFLAQRAAARKDRAGFPAAAPARLSLPERSLVLTMASEGAMVTSLMDEIGSTPGLVVSELGGASPRFWAWLLPFKPRMTLNRLVQPSVDAARASLMSAKDFEAYAKDYKVIEPGNSDYYFNTVGTMLYAMQPNYFTYVRRCNDLDAFIVLTQVAHKLLAERVTAAGVDAVLAALPPELRDPVDGAAPVWRDGVLSFSDEKEHESSVKRALPLAL